MFNIYAGEILASSCNGRKCYFSLKWARMFNFPDIRCVITPSNFPRISRQLELPFPNIIMKILSFPNTFMEGG